MTTGMMEIRFVDERSQDEIRLELFNQSFIQLMKTRDGRRFVWGMLEKTGFTGAMHRTKQTQGIKKIKG